MSNVKVDAISSNYYPRPIIDGINDRETITATSGQTVFTLTQFDRSYDVIAFNGSTPVTAVWNSTTQVTIGTAANAGDLIHFYKGPARAALINYINQSGNEDTLQNFADGINSVNGKSIPVSTGTTTTLNGILQCSNYTVNFGSDPLVDGRVYEFIPHASNPSWASDATTINGKPVFAQGYSKWDTGTYLINLWKAIRPGYICRVYYDSNSDFFRLVNQIQNVSLSDRFSTSSSGSSFNYGFLFTRSSTGVYSLNLNVDVTAQVFVMPENSNYNVWASYLSIGGNIDFTVRDLSGNLTDDALTIGFMTVF
jgi:hypothetical protein